MRISARAAVIRKRPAVLVTDKPWEVLIWSHLSGYLIFWVATRGRAIEIIEVFT